MTTGMFEDPGHLYLVEEARASQVRQPLLLTGRPRGYDPPLAQGYQSRPAGGGNRRGKASTAEKLGEGLELRHCATPI